MTAPYPTPSPGSILLVDDEPVVLGATKSALEIAGYPTVACQSVTEALALVKAREFAVIMSDQRLPEMTGLDFLIACRGIRPESTRILVTSMIDLGTIIGAVNRGEIYRFIQKPWIQEDLIAAVRNAMQRYELMTANAALLSERERLNQSLTRANQNLEAMVADLKQGNARLDNANSELEKRYRNSLELCRRILATYDPQLGSQAKALADLADQMANDPGFNENERHTLRSAARLCDLGLVGVSHELLRAFRRDGRVLSERDRNVIEHHPIYSQTLAGFVDPRPEIAETIRAHHERYDGEGYPDHLAGDHVPWPARCLAVAVAFVESTLERTATIDRILEESGKAFDPEAVRLFLRIAHLVDLPKQVREVLLRELKPGMVLASEITTPSGLLLIGAGVPLSEATIGKIRNHNEVTPLTQLLKVYH
jgi:response regulator RpfG family c-di-GMP phosphodiesterase